MNYSEIREVYIHISFVKNLLKKCHGLIFCWLAFVGTGDLLLSALRVFTIISPDGTCEEFMNL